MICEDLPPPQNGRWSSVVAFVGEGVKLVCDFGYSRKGSGMVQCGSDRRWYGVESECVSGELASLCFSKQGHRNWCVCVGGGGWWDASNAAAKYMYMKRLGWPTELVACHSNSVMSQNYILSD